MRCAFEEQLTMGATLKVPDGYHVVTPYFTVPAADLFVTFLVDVFGGVVLLEKRDKNDVVQHVRVQIGDTIIMLNEANEIYSANISQMHLFVSNVEETFAKALSAGAVAIMEPNVRPHGDRMAGIKDPSGNIWWIATPS